MLGPVEGVDRGVMDFLKAFFEGETAQLIKDALHAPGAAPAGVVDGGNEGRGVHAPGVIETPMIAATLATEEGRIAMAEGAPAPYNAPAAPPTAPAALPAWLTSEENFFVTGQIIFIDGGAKSILRPDVV